MGNWENNDGLFIQYGTDKATSEVAGEFKTYGQTQTIELLLDLTKLTSTASVVSNTLIFPATSNTTTQKIYVEQVEIYCETAVTNGTGAAVDLNLGLIRSDATNRTTSISDTAFINNLDVHSYVYGQKTTLNEGSSGAGSYLGTAPTSTNTGYLSAKTNSGTFDTGVLRIRIFYRFGGTIAN